MQYFFLSLATFTAALFLAAFGFASLIPDRLYHLYAGLFAAIACLFTHCWVFFYFIGTGQGIREGIEEHKLDARHLKTMRRFKGRVFPFAFFSMIFVIVGSIMGGAIRAGKASPTAHLGWIFFAVVFNLFTFRRELSSIRENRELMEKLNREIGTMSHTRYSS